MSTSSTTLRLITLLFLLAGLLLLRKPVFGQTNATSPQIRLATLSQSYGHTVVYPEGRREPHPSPDRSTKTG